MVAFTVLAKSILDNIRNMYRHYRYSVFDALQAAVLELARTLDGPDLFLNMFHVRTLFGLHKGGLCSTLMRNIGMFHMWNTMSDGRTAIKLESEAAIIVELLAPAMFHMQHHAVARKHVWFLSPVEFAMALNNLNHLESRILRPTFFNLSFLTATCLIPNLLDSGLDSSWNDRIPWLRKENLFSNAPCPMAVMKQRSWYGRAPSEWETWVPRRGENGREWLG